MPVREEPPVDGAVAATDTELLRRTAADGDREAFAVFAERHQSAVYRHVAYLLTGRREDAEDVLQETFLSALKHAGQFRGEASARTWLLRIAHHAALRRRNPSSSSGPGLATGVESEQTLEALAAAAGWGRLDTPETLAMLAEDRARLEAALARLPAEEREVVLLRDREELSGDQVAALLSISLAAMKSRLHRGRIRLAALLRTESGGEQESRR